MKYKFFLLSIFQVCFLFAQNITVSGTVVSNSEPLPGVSVLIKNTLKGTTTDFDGKYSINAKKGDILIFSLMFFNEKEVVVTESIHNVTLEEGNTFLDEVVVTAFGVEKEEKSLGYSVSEIKTDDLSPSGQMNSVTALQGKVAGLDIRQTSGSAGGGVDILVRGISSLTPSSNNQPLIVVDGVAINNDTFSGNILPTSGSNSSGSNEQFSYSSRSNDINPNDIESYNILKGAAATALYGIQGANGVIIITTKKGKVGKAKFSVNSSTTIRKVNKTPKFQRKYREGYLGGPRLLYTPNSSTGFTKVSSSTPFHTWGPLYSDDTFVTDSGEIIDLSNDQFYDPYELFKTGQNLQLNFNVSGATEKIDYYFSVGNSKDKGILPNSTYDKTSVRFKANYKISEKFTIGSSVQYTNSGGKRANGGDKSVMSSLAYYSPTFPINDYINPDGTQRNYTPYLDNPRYFTSVSGLTDDVNRWIGSVKFNWKPKTWIDINYTAQVDNYNDFRNRFVPPELDAGSQVNGFLVDENINYVGLESNLLTSFNIDFNEVFNASLTLGNQVQDYKTVYDRIYGEGLNLPNFNDVSNTSIRDASHNLKTIRNIGVFGELKFDYDNMIFLTITGRNDWVSTLPKSNNTFFYPSISLAYNLKSLFRNSSFFSFGKIRASYAEVGKGAGFGRVGSYFLADGDFPWGNIGGYRADTSIGDPNLNPQRLQGYEIGTDLRFFRNRIRLDYSYYNNTITNQIFAVDTPPSTGLTSITRNAGSYENRGHEFLLSADVIKNENFNWNLTYNFAKSEGFAKSLPDDIEYVQFAGDNAPELFLRVKEGDKMGTLYGYNWRYENGKRYIGADGYPVLDDENGYQIVGNALPDYIMSLGSNINWKGFGLDFLVEWKKGGDKYSWARRNMIRNGTSIVTEQRNIDDFVLDGVMDDPNNPGNYIKNTNPTSDGLDESYYRSWSRYTGAAEVYLQDASWVKLRNVGLTYSLPYSLLEQLKMTQIIVSANANNILLWTPYDGYDPEGSNYSAGSNIYGFSGRGIPLTESYTLGVKVGF